MKVNNSKGFTLIEMMVTVAIIGILAAIAYPSYQNYAMESRRAEAYTAMTGIALAQSKLRGNCTTYAGTIATSSDCSTSKVKGLSTSENGYYTLAISNSSGNSYTITATAQGVQTADSACTPLTYTVSPSNPNGLKGPSGCW